MMESRMLGNLLVRFGGGLFVIESRKTNPTIETQIIYPYNLITSFSAKAMPTDNACMEAFWANMKRETIHYEKMQNLDELQIIEIITDYIEYYNMYRKMNEVFQNFGQLFTF
ncbi:integrase core domain-containing protein [Candidatus Phytoplasma australiense]|uniref:Putative transposase tra5 for insertion sequence element IS150 n=1 Tax=Strawberry lethal yellows phytoplasma (CPA) str. NZSb11 TaxID=980422 RepID=R4RZU1_PHYAS|nr:Putative transposase tra5 for insertion sequence element IS150 [Strawberry lethal yellows phytoplasma (CPA) str. NZSb11]